MFDAATIPLLESFAQALETMAFISPMPMEDPDRRPQQALACELVFAGPISGRLLLVADQTLGKAIVSNIFNITPDDPVVEQRCRDALMELTNIACGRLLAKLSEGFPARFEMTVPVVREFDTEKEWKQLAAADGVTLLDADGALLGVQLVIDS